MATQDARKAADSGSTKAILATLREQASTN